MKDGTMNEGQDFTSGDLESTAAALMGHAPAETLGKAVEAAYDLGLVERLPSLARQLETMAREMRAQFIYAAKAASVALQSLVAAAVPEVALMHRRVKHGGMSDTARRWPEEWQSYACAGFLCGSCPSDEFGLECQCPHHRKRSR